MTSTVTCARCGGTGLETRHDRPGCGRFLCADCGGLGHFTKYDDDEALFHNVMQPGLHKAVAAWSVLFVMHVAHAWLGVAVRKLERWVAS